MPDDLSIDRTGRTPHLKCGEEGMEQRAETARSPTTRSAVKSFTDPKDFHRTAFDRAYSELILGQRFFEAPSYYTQQKARYLRTLQLLHPRLRSHPCRILEIGGGQIALLAQALYGYSPVVADISDRWSDPGTKHGIEFAQCDLVRDELGYRDHFDLVVLCEVIEHVPIPAHLVFEKILRWIAPGGMLFLTTPNLYRLRNVVRLAIGQQIFCPLWYPERGISLGHPMEFSAKNLQWHLEKAGFTQVEIRFIQLVNRGASPATQLGRCLAAPCLWVRPLWRDNLVAFAEKDR